jgi:chromosome segregation ATPase
MTTASITLDREPLRSSFRDWQAEQELLDTELNESLTALEAYQSHLDLWQRELARQRDELQKTKLETAAECEQLQQSTAELTRQREELERDRLAHSRDLDELQREQSDVARDRAALECDRSLLDLDRSTFERDRSNPAHDHAVDGANSTKVDELEHELFDARAKIASLTTSLLDRTDELRRLDRQRAEVTAELVVAKSREKELASVLESPQKSSDQQRMQREAAIAQMREQPENSLGTAPVEAASAPAASDPPLGPIAAANPVLGSLMQQFDKLRQQRSVARQNHPRPR